MPRNKKTKAKTTVGGTRKGRGDSGTRRTGQGSKKPRTKARRSFPVSEATSKLSTTGLVEVVADELGTEKDAIQVVVDDVLDVVREALLNGHPVALAGIGTLNPYVRKATRNYHPSTGELREVPPRLHVKLRLSPGLDRALKEVNV